MHIILINFIFYKINTSKKKKKKIPEYINRNIEIS